MSPKTISYKNLPSELKSLTLQKYHFFDFTMGKDKELNRLKIALLEQKRTSKWLAEQLGVDPTTVSKWCTNTYQPPLQTLIDIANLLEIPVQNLINQNCATTPQTVV